MTAAGILKRTAAAIGAIVLLAILAFAAGVLWPLDELEPPPRDARPLAITGVAVVDVREGRSLPDRTVLVEGGRITAVGPAAELSVPTDARRIDGRGRWLIPALWDMHAHVYAVSPLLDMPLYVAHGVLSVRDMQGCPKAGDPFIACAGDKRRWTEEAESGRRIGPRIVATTSFMANGPGTLARVKGVPSYFGTSTADDARRFVRHFADSADAIKVYDRLPRDAYLAIVDEARRAGLDVVGHRPLGVSAEEAAAGMKSIEHARFVLHESWPGADSLRALAGTAAWREDRRRMLDEHDTARADAIFAAMRAHGTWYVPTHLTRWSDAWADDARVREDSLLRYLHPLMKMQWLEDIDAIVARDPSPEARATYREFHAKALELTGRAHRAGVRVLAGSDYIVAGADLHRELEQLVAAGLSPADALRAATLSPAEYVGVEREQGTVEAGKVADLVLLSADPLADVRNARRIEAVVYGGTVYDRPMIDRIHRHVERRARSWAVGCRMVWRFVRSPAAY